MNSRIVKTEVKEKGFPKLMVSRNGVIVLFSSEKEGVVIQKGAGTINVGSNRSNWAPDSFEDFNDELILKN